MQEYMEMCIEDEKFDTKLEPFDWRYSAAIVGLHKYLNFLKREEDIEFQVLDDALYFNRSDVTEEKYLCFVEDYYGDELHHKKLEKIIHKEECSDEEIKLANELMKGNSVLKKVFGKLKFDGNNQKEILDIIHINRKTLIKETFRNKSNMYANFANTGQLLEEGKACCRLLGYYVDGGRKSKAISYRFDVSTFVAQDEIVFDFIPFAFLGDRESFFINDSFSVEQLITTNRNFEQYIKDAVSESQGKNKDARKVLFKSIQTVTEFLDYDIEVIVKNRDNAFFETLYIRKESSDILKALEVYEPFCFSLKMNDNYYINIQKEVMDCILNLVRTDYLIELFLKQRKQNSGYLVSLLIKVNRLICGGGDKMEKSMKIAYACARAVVESKHVTENKCESYRQKLLSSIIFKDYDRFCQILLQLSNYAEVNFDFAYDLFEDFEANKDVAYTFINALTKRENKQKENSQEEQ